jgi:hypothetical protein
MTARLLKLDEALYEALKAPLGLIVLGDWQLLQEAKERLQRDDPSMADLSILGPDLQGQVFLARKWELKKLWDLQGRENKESAQDG